MREGGARSWLGFGKGGRDRDSPLDQRSGVRAVETVKNCKRVRTPARDVFRPETNFGRIGDILANTVVDVLDPPFFTYVVLVGPKWVQPIFAPSL